MFDFNKVKEFAGEETVVEEVAETAVANVDPFDLAKIKKDFEPYLATIENMGKRAEAHKVTDETSVGQAVAMAGQVKDLYKKIEAQRKDIVDEPNKFVKAVNGFTKMFTDKLNTIEAGLKRKIGDYSYKVETERREAEAKAQAEARKLQEKINKAAEKKGIEPVQVVIPVSVEKPSVIRSETGASSSIRKKWKARIVDPDKVDRVFCSPDLKKLQEAVDTGIREIGGCEVFEEITTVLRS